MIVNEAELGLNSDVALEWQAEENHKATRHLQGLPMYQYFVKGLNAIDSAVEPEAYVPAGGLLFQRVSGDEQLPFDRIEARSSPGATPRVIFDAGVVAETTGQPASIDPWAWAPSPDGTKLAVIYSPGGSEVTRIGLYDTTTGLELTHKLPWTGAGQVAWRPDSGALLVTVRQVGDNGHFTGHMELFETEIGAEPPDSPEPIGPVTGFFQANYSDDGKHVIVHTGTARRAEWMRTPEGTWQPLLPPANTMAIGVIVGDDLLWLTTDGAPRGRVMRCPLRESQDTSAWREVIPETEDVLLSFEVVNDYIVCGGTRNTSGLLKIFSIEGAWLRDVVPPGLGTISIYSRSLAASVIPMFHVDEGSVSFVHSTPNVSHVHYRYDVALDALEALSKPLLQLGELRVDQIEARSKDGTRILATVVHPDELSPRARPTWVSCYGSFGMSLTPGFEARIVPWLQAGGVFAIAHVRGGGEFGQDWHAQGSLSNKQNTYDDLYSVVEELIDLGITTPEQLGLEGASAGGLLAGVAMLQRPDLWSAVVARSPLFDLLGADRDPLTLTIMIREYGDPRDPAQSPWIRPISPVEIVNGPRPLPASVFISGENDPRCPAWHSRKLAALVQQANTANRENLLRVVSDRGHASVGRDATHSEFAEWMAFLADQTGLSEVSPP